MRIRIAVFVPALLFLFTFFSIPVSSAEETGWTVLVYMVGTDLESNDFFEGGENATRDLLEMQRSVQDHTELLVMTGGAQKWWFKQETDYPIPSDRCCIWSIKKDHITCLWEGQGSMGHPDMLGILLNYLPSGGRKSALIFWDHGYGPLEGFGNDQTSEDRRLTLPEIITVFKNREMEKNPISLIGFDACFMSSCETVLSLSPYADYLIASEDIEPPEGWNYSFLETLSEIMSAEEAGREIVELYGETYQSRQEAYGLSLVDLNQSELLGHALNGLFAALEKRVLFGEFSSVSRLRAELWDYARSTGGTEYDLVDVRELAAGSGTGQDALDALNKSIVCHVSNRERAHGLSVYFPQKAEGGTRRRWEAELETLSPGASWISFIRSFETALMAGETAHYRNAHVAEKPYSFELTDAQLSELSSARYVVLKETERNCMRIVYAGNNCTLDGNIIRANYQGTTLWFCSGDQKIPMVPILNQQDSQNAYYSTTAVVYGNHHSVMAVDLQIVQEKETSEWKIFSAYPIGDSFVTGRREVSLKDFHEIHLSSGLKTPRWNQEGVLLPWKQWDQLNQFDGPACEIQDSYFVEEAPLQKEPGTLYWLQVIITDIYNNEYASELVPI